MEETSGWEDLPRAHGMSAATGPLALSHCERPDRTDLAPASPRRSACLAAPRHQEGLGLGWRVGPSASSSATRGFHRLPRPDPDAALARAHRRGDAAGPRHFGEDLQGLLAAEDL